jgi:hydrophobic/amphiphilic exporter-1 (mainly G- bacteria), HAE1 family
MTITELAIKRSTLVVIVFTALTLLGIYCYSMLNYELIPKMDVPMISVTTQYSGASADEVESSVTKNLEDALSALENVKYMSSTSQEGSSSISIELEANTNTDVALQEAQRKVNAVLYLLPSGAKTPSLASFSTDQIPILKLGVKANMDATKLYQLTKDQIKPQISKINGVAQVTLIGGDQRQIRINVYRSKLTAYNITISQLYSVVNNANQQFASGKIEGNKSQYTVRLSGKFSSLDQIRNIVITHKPDGSEVKLSDIAEVEDGIADYTSLSRINGDNSIGMQIQKQSDANSVTVTQSAKEAMTKMEKQYESYGLKFVIATDNSVYTLASANAVMEDLIIAIALVSIVMFLFLHSFRNSLIVLVSIPVSIVSVFTAMYICSFSLNLMTLMALSLIIGILVDDSIVVLENIHRHLSMGKDKSTAALDGRSEIGFTAVAITFVDVVVFVPLALISGMIGSMLKEFALVVVFATLMSLIVSFTVTPLLASRFSRIEKLTRDTILGKIALTFEDFYKKLVAFYQIVLQKALQNRKKVFFTLMFLFVASFALIGMDFIGTEFMPNGDKGEFVVQLEGDPQNTLQQTNQLTEKVEKILFAHSEVQKVFSSIGYASSMVGTTSESHKAEITVTIIDKQKRKQTVAQYAAMIKTEILSKVPGVKITSTPSSTFGSSEAPIQVLLRGSDMNEIYKTADTIMATIKDVPGINDIRLSVEKSKPEMHIQIDRDKMSALGLSISDVGNTLQYALAGNTDLQYSDNGTDYDINIQLDAFDRKKVEDIGSINFKTTTGENIELKQFASVYQALGPNKLERYDRISSLTIKSEVYGRPVGTVGAEIKKKINANIHSNNVTIEYKGQTERQSDAFSSLFLALATAILLVYFVMVALYNSYMYPFVVLFSLPVAVIGALLALALSGNNISVYVLIGMIMLMGLVAKNAILLVDFTNKLRENGTAMIDALIEAGKERLRPILMTTVAMVFGMLPLATATGVSSESKNGLAWVIIGGLTSSLVLTLILVPVVYVSMENIRTRIRNKYGHRTKSVEQAAPNNA